MSRKHCVIIAKILLLTLFIVITTLFLSCTIGNTNNVQQRIYDYNETNDYIKFQDRMSLDWDADQNMLLLKLVEMKGGTTEDKAYNIIVTLNRVLHRDYPNSIEGVVANEMLLMNVDATSFNNVHINETTEEAMKLVIYKRIDKTNGSLVYKEDL